MTEQQRQARNRYQARWRKQHARDGLCTVCTAPAANGYRTCERHHERIVQQARARRLASRQQPTGKTGERM